MEICCRRRATQKRGISEAITSCSTTGFYFNSLLIGTRVVPGVGARASAGGALWGEAGPPHAGRSRFRPVPAASPQGTAERLSSAGSWLGNGCENGQNGWGKKKIKYNSCESPVSAGGGRGALGARAGVALKPNLRKGDGRGFSPSSSVLISNKLIFLFCPRR